MQNERAFAIYWRGDFNSSGKVFHLSVLIVPFFFLSLSVLIKMRLNIFIIFQLVSGSSNEPTHVSLLAVHLSGDDNLRITDEQIKCMQVKPTL